MAAKFRKRRVANRATARVSGKRRIIGAVAAREAMAELVHLALLDTTGESPVSSRAARRAERPSGGSPRRRKTE